MFFFYGRNMLPMLYTFRAKGLTKNERNEKRWGFLFVLCFDPKRVFAINQM